MIVQNQESFVFSFFRNFSLIYGYGLQKRHIISDRASFSPDLRKARAIERKSNILAGGGRE